MRITPPALLASLLALAVGCEPYNPGAPVSPSAAAPAVPREPDMRVVSDDEAAAAGLTARDLALTFPAGGASGAEMLAQWFGRAKESGWRVGGVAMYIVHDRENDTVECRTSIFAETSMETRFVPPSSRITNVYTPVQRLVTHMESRCQLVSHPEMHSETTYTSQYDFASKSMHSVPQTRMVTTQVMRTDCHMEPVSTFVTQWEWTPELRYTPPTTEYLATKRLREGEPACYAVQQGAVTRVEGKVFVDSAAKTAPAAPDQAPLPADAPAGELKP